MTVASSSGTPGDAPGRGAFSPRQAHEQQPAHGFACPAVLAVALAVVALVAVLLAAGVGHVSSGLRIVAGAITVAAVLVAPGFVVVQPNESRVLILFGRYVGTVVEARLWWVNPFTVFWRKGISLRVRNFQSERIKVNDASGNPIEIAAVVVWRVTDTAKATFDVEDFEQFVVVQSETAVRHLASKYPTTTTARRACRCAEARTRYWTASTTSSKVGCRPPVSRCWKPG